MSNIQVHFSQWLVYDFIIADTAYGGHVTSAEWLLYNHCFTFLLVADELR